MFKKTALLAAALIASTALQPVPKAHANNGAGAAIGLAAGLIVAAAAANAAARQQACQQWLPVVNDQRYDAATRAYALQTVTSCGLNVAYVAPVASPAPAQVAALPAPAPMPAPVVYGTVGTEVPLGGDHREHVVNSVVNDVAPVRFSIDTGSSVTSIPLEIAVALIKVGRLTAGDVRGDMIAVLADGSRSRSRVVMLSSITVGGRTVRNVRAAVLAAGTTPLLGLNFFQQFASYSIDNRRGVLVLN